MICKILRQFINTFTVDDKYSVLNRDKLLQLIQMQLSGKEKAFSQCFYSVLKSRLNFEHFEKKMITIADVFPELQTSKKVVR